MAKKKNLTDRQKRIRRRRRKSTMSRVVFALEIIILVVLMGGLFVYAKLGNMNYEDLNFENVDVNQSVEENQVMKGYTSIALVGLDSREGELDGDVNSDTMIIASINNDTKKVKLVSIYVIRIFGLEVIRTAKMYTIRQILRSVQVVRKK